MWMEELPNGKFTYRERYKDPYTEKYKKVSVTLNSKSNQAKNKAQRMLNEKIEKTLNKPQKTGMRFGSLYRKWATEFPKTVKERTFKTYKYPTIKIRNYFKDDIIIDNLKKQDIKEFLEEKYYTEDYSYNYVNQIRNILISMFDYSTLEMNPARGISLKRKPATFEENEQIKQKYLEHEEAEKIIAYQREALYGKRNADLTEFMLLTGLRFGEAVSLKEKDFDGNSITVNSTLDYVSHKTSEGHQTTTKTKNSQRVVELSDRAIEIMNEVIYENSLRALTEKYSDRKFIFTTKTGNPLHITNYNHSLKITAKNIGVDKTVTSHILRHTHVSMLAELRLPLKAIMNRVGHEDSKTTENIYTHVTKGMKKELINKLNEIVPYSCPISDNDQDKHDKSTDK